MDAKLTALFSINLAFTKKIPAKSVEMFFWENGILVMLRHTILCPKTANIQMLLDVGFLKWNAKKKRQKMPYYTLYEIAISDFRNFCIFNPKNRISIFSRNKCPKNIFLIDNQKQNVHIIGLCAVNMCTKFHANIFIFACAYVQTPSNGSDVTFWKLDFWNSELSYDKTNDVFGNPATKLEKIGMF